MAAYERQEVRPCVLCGVYDAPAHYGSQTHKERLEELSLPAHLRPVRPGIHPSSARCNCCKVPTQTTGMCDGCLEIHGKRLSRKAKDGRPTCWRARACDEGIDWAFAKMREQPRPPTRTISPETRRALDLLDATVSQIRSPE